VVVTEGLPPGDQSPPSPSSPSWRGPSLAAKAAARGLTAEDALDTLLAVLPKQGGTALPQVGPRHRLCHREGLAPNPAIRRGH